MSETTKVRVISATTLKENQVLELKELMTKKLGKKVEILTEIDHSLIGGLYIRYDGFVIDYTVKKRLQDLKDSIKKRGVG